MNEHLRLTIMDMVTNFLYYDRKEDEELPVGAIEEEIRSGRTSIDEIVEVFHSEFSKGVLYEHYGSHNSYDMD